VEELGRRATSVAISGPDRFAITRVAVGLARRLDSGFRWMDIRRSAFMPESWQLVLEATMPIGSFSTIDASALHPDPDAAYAAASLVTANGATDPSSARLAELLLGSLRGRAPLVSGTTPPPPHVLLLTNVERASAAFEGRAGALRPYIEAFNAVNITVLLSACSRPRENKSDVDFVLRVEPSDDPERTTEVVVTETNRGSGEFPPIPPGSRYTVTALARAVA
jgi:hypothetical protein